MPNPAPVPDESLRMDLVAAITVCANAYAKVGPKAESLFRSDVGSLLSGDMKPGRVAAEGGES